jgi:hypothetical protein
MFREKGSSPVRPIRTTGSQPLLEVSMKFPAGSLGIEERIIRVPICGCWLWTGQLTEKGYSYLVHNHKAIFGHRWLWESTNGPIPPSMHVLHKCDVRCCVNPHHLFLGTQTDNNKDRDLKGRQRVPKGSAHPFAKLREQDVLFIRSYPGKKTPLARMFGVSTTTICDIKKRRTWNHI